MTRAVRGATTVETNGADEIIEKTAEMLKKIIDDNDIKTDDLVSALFSVTSDLNATFPAVAARKLGWTNIALLDTYEIDVPGSLKKCIRVMIHFNTEKKNDEIQYVYLHGAKILRPDIKQ